MPSKRTTPRASAAERASKLAAIADLNARTVCAHCGVQPVEWHNPEHVELGRESFRIGNLVRSAATFAAILTEIGRCTPLCRRCHMREDGRLQALVAMAQATPRIKVGLLPCTECERPYKPLRRGLCSRCYDRHRHVPKGTHAGRNGEPPTEKQLAGREAMHASTRGRPLSPEHRAKIGAATKANHLARQAESSACRTVIHKPRQPEATS